MVRHLAASLGSTHWVLVASPSPVVTERCPDVAHVPQGANPPLVEKLWFKKGLQKGFPVQGRSERGPEGGKFGAAVHSSQAGQHQAGGTRQLACRMVLGNYRKTDLTTRHEGSDWMQPGSLTSIQLDNLPRERISQTTSSSEEDQRNRRVASQEAW